MAKKPTELRLFFVSDLHWPHTDLPVLVRSLELAREFKPDVFVLGGDIYDSECVSKYGPNPHLINDLQGDIETFKGYQDTILGTFPKVVFLHGNHEDRLQKYLQAKAPAIQRLIKPNALFMGGLCSSYVKSNSFYKPVHDLFLIHGSTALKNHGTSVREHYTQLGGSVVMGHTHKHSLQVLTVGGRNIVLVENGHMMDESKAQYEHRPWQQSAGLAITVATNGKWVDILDFPVVNGHVRGTSL